MPARNRSAPPKPTTPRKRSTPVRPESMIIKNPLAAGIDVHSDMHMVCVPHGCFDPGDTKNGMPPHVQRFGAYTANLREIADWLKECGVTTVAMESTSVYWIPLFELLEERGFEVYLVDPGQLSRCGARPKTDVLDCQWIQRLHTYGLLTGSFRPPQQVLALRGYYRQRQNLVRYAASHVQHMQKALEQMNVKLTEVLADITGVTGTRIIKAILDGERNPQVLVKLRDKHCQKSEEEIALALEGTWRAEHLFELKQAFELVQIYQEKVTECDRMIEQELGRMPKRSGDKPLDPKSRKRGRKRNDLSFEGRPPLFQALGVDLTAIEGIDVGTTLMILSEIGVDISRFPTEKHFSAWLRLCPGKGRSNKTEKKRGKRKGMNRVALTLRMAARALGKTQSALGAYYRRMRSRLGGQAACTATAHKLARLVYRMLMHGTEYVVKSMEEYEAKMRDQQERSLRRRARRLGYELVPKTGANKEPASER